ncbi:MAG TPA: ATP phosphoribosyltransferase [Elusimicrobia bacterium]|nr:MAG: ATP phosphoribosyltransferase [Elusimicrobia bacterium RIFOXYA12_FULL_49_49]OGS09642.1 MAG: ATP phosphoribosyltransferase [Elusimicrobia bacterium RIFOXYA1_FULL_47_7]OGS10742.1 MAG: ATP phosphoribosyltransferase [Elusimicrobia bacterium RIFOXYB1_FULL_48_9]OGS14799.1 MAG: ATP phosphoribosyltransferase [Elusimicrobia bacterium RIFOXYA2_FULL_47_53]OGS25551.1 MAG: ATP phosphoribosyltransferase [Elusimicrobia bacterium RIFOXYB12_FULL_50_12]OGS28917.1 MAG: ATP phosphoribosyltransferase [Elus
MKKLKLGFPKGSLQESTLELFKKAGIKINATSRSYFPTSDDDELEIMMVRSQEMAKYVEDGVFDAGLTGFDWICESGAKVKEVCELLYAKSGFRPVRWVLAVPNDSKVRSIKDLKGKRVATELINYVKKYFARKKVKAEIEFSWGATEAKTPALVDAIVELTETGSSLRANNLRIVEDVLTSTTRLIANSKAWNDPWKREKIENLAILLQGALAAEGMVGLKMNVDQKNLEKVKKILPALKKPTLSRLDGLPGWVALEVIIEEKIVKKILPGLKRAGAEGIIEYPLNKIIY